MVLATEPGIWIPAVVLGHLIGICFLLYSLEKTNGSVSRLWKRMTVRGSGKGVDGAGVGATAGSAAPVKLMRGMSADNEPLHYERAPRWVRGCSCKVKIVHERGIEGRRRSSFLHSMGLNLPGTTNRRERKGGGPQGKENIKARPWTIAPSSRRSLSPIAIDGDTGE